MGKIGEEERSRLQNQLVKLADLMETCDYGDADHKEYNREYRKIAKILYPEMYRSQPPKRRMPSQKFIRTLMPCDCGEKTFRYKSNDNGIQILCKKCPRKSEILKTNSEARDSWNINLKNKIMTGLDLISKERQEQFEKHGITISDDALNHTKGELSEVVSLICLPNIGCGNIEVPKTFNKDMFNKILNKPYKERLVIAGALICAELDRVELVDK